MAIGRKETPEFFAENPFDPIKAASGSGRQYVRDELLDSSLEEKNNERKRRPKDKSTREKKKAGFYLSLEILDRFTRKFHELKLEGITIENKSALVEAALTFALDDIDKGEDSLVLKKI